MSTKKTYWKGYSEKHQTPSFMESSQKEFQEKIPVDQFLSDDGINDLKSGRRDFLKFMGFSLAAATLASCEAPIIKSIPYVNKPEEITPGVANWYSSSYYDGNDYANILVNLWPGNLDTSSNYVLTDYGIGKSFLCDIEWTNEIQDNMFYKN